MKTTIERAVFLKLLQSISGIVEKRHTIAILANTLMKIHDNTLSLATTDLEIEMIGTIALQGSSEEGATTVAARKLLDICRSLPDDAVIDLTLEGANLIVRSAGSRFSLATLPASEFPSLDDITFRHEFVIHSAKFRELLSKTYFAMGQQDVRHHLNGVLFDINQGVMKCVATDGHRLAYSAAEHANLAADCKVIIPRKSVLELLRLLPTEDDSEITIAIGDNHLRVIRPDFTFTSKLINANYPNYQKLIPKQMENTFTADREALKQALTRASILSNDKFRGVRIQFEPDMLKISANNAEQEEAEEIVNLQYQGSSVEIGFNVSYLLDVLSTIVAKTIRWSFSNANGGILIESADHNDSLYVVMPMKL